MSSDPSSHQHPDQGQVRSKHRSNTGRRSPEYRLGSLRHICAVQVARLAGLDQALQPGAGHYYLDVPHSISAAAGFLGCKDCKAWPFAIHIHCVCQPHGNSPPPPSPCPPAPDQFSCAAYAKHLCTKATQKALENCPPYYKNLLGRIPRRLMEHSVIHQLCS